MRWPPPTACASSCQCGPSIRVRIHAILGTSTASPGTISPPTSSPAERVTVPGTLRDSLNLLAVVLEQETELQPTEIMTDTAGYTDTIFGIFLLLGYHFAHASPMSAVHGSGASMARPTTACSMTLRRTKST